MKKSDLKTGMVVETRCKGRWLVVNNILLSQTGYMPLDRWNEDMYYIECSCDSTWDIMKVWEQKELCNLYSMLDKSSDWLNEDRFGHLIWDREKGDCVDMTLEEVCAALGKNVRIVKSK